MVGKEQIQCWIASLLRGRKLAEIVTNLNACDMNEI